MSLFNFLKKENPPKEVMGRYQELCMVNLMLGENVVELELKVAKNKDIEERDTFLSELKDAEKDINSSDLANPFDMTRLYTRVSKLMDGGYDNCVLQNDRELENKCLKLLSDIFEVMKRALNDTTGTQVEEVIDLRAAKALLMWQKLGGLLQTGDQEQCWFLASSIYYPKQRIGRWSESSLIKMFLPLLSESDFKIMADYIRTMKIRLVEQERITYSQASFIEDELIESHRQNIEAHKKRTQAI